MESTFNFTDVAHIGTDTLVGHFNDLLANYSVFYMNVRGFNWNVRGAQFFELQQQFQSLAADLSKKTDRIAAQVLEMGAQPMHTYSDFLELTNIAEVCNVCDGRDAVVSILDSLRILLIKQRDLLWLADEAGDRASCALLSDCIDEQENWVWTFSAFSQV